MQEAGGIHVASSKEALQARAYERIAGFFEEREDYVCEIEVLPATIPPPDGILLQDGLNLGLPKKVLVLAYAEARRRFLDSKDDDSLLSAALQATKIMLLFDPEHLTAANYRKRWINNLKADSGSHFGSAFHKALRQELNFLNTILTSPLHRQTKSPTMWHHRLWMMGPLADIVLNNSDDDQYIEFWHAELGAICKSGERHPNNYYAWQYARKITPWMVRVKEKSFLDGVKDWCCKHPSDISGWTFLLFLLSYSQKETLANETLRAVLNYAIRLRSEQESLWIFIRTVAVRYITKESHVSLCSLLQEQDDEAIIDESLSKSPVQSSNTSRWLILKTQFLQLRNGSGSTF
ncbi:hypothetical protein NX059_008834 [Plenodomus lindquistii]|nr:hypothetical protein NX059_008834 [Plenodomus lindquistii]